MICSTIKKVAALVAVGLLINVQGTRTYKSYIDLAQGDAPGLVKYKGLLWYCADLECRIKGDEQNVDGEVGLHPIFYNDHTGIGDQYIKDLGSNPKFRSQWDSEKKILTLPFTTMPKAKTEAFEHGDHLEVERKKLEVEMRAKSFKKMQTQISKTKAQDMHLAKKKAEAAKRRAKRKQLEDIQNKQLDAQLRKLHGGLLLGNGEIRVVMRGSHPFHGQKGMVISGAEGFAQKESFVVKLDNGQILPNVTVKHFKLVDLSKPVKMSRSLRRKIVGARYKREETLFKRRHPEWQKKGALSKSDRRSISEAANRNYLFGQTVKFISNRYAGETGIVTNRFQNGEYMIKRNNGQGTTRENPNYLEFIDLKPLR